MEKILSLDGYGDGYVGEMARWFLERRRYAEIKDPEEKGSGSGEGSPDPGQAVRMARYKAKERVRRVLSAYSASTSTPWIRNGGNDFDLALDSPPESDRAKGKHQVEREREREREREA